MTATRVTTEQLQAIVNRLNVLTNSPLQTYVTDASTGKYISQEGNYHLSQAYGGHALHRIVGESGGVTDVLGRGHMPKKELAELMWAYIRGLEQGKELSK